MSKRAAYIILSLAIVAVLAVGGLIYFRGEGQQQNAGVAPLPQNAVAYGQWALIGCQPGAGDGACRMVRRVINAEAQRVVLSFAVTRIANGPALIVIGLPPSVVIPRGVTITPEGGTAAVGRIIRCGPQLCTAALPINDTLVAEMSDAQSMGLQFVAANGREVNLNIQNAGFREGFAAWLAASPPPAEGADADAPVSDETVPDAETVEQ